MLQERGVINPENKIWLREREREEIHPQNGKQREGTERLNCTRNERGEGRAGRMDKGVSPGSSRIRDAVSKVKLLLQYK